MNCIFKKTNDAWVCEACNLQVPIAMSQATPQANCVMKKRRNPPTQKTQAQTKEQRLQFVALHCWDCQLSGVPDSEKPKTLKTINCPQSCGCSATKAEPVVLRLMDKRFKCPANRF